jgi:hypothetical protein
MSKIGRPQQLRAEVIKLLKDPRLSLLQRIKFVTILYEIDGYRFKSDLIDTLPTKEELLAQDADERIRKALVKGESHGADAGADTSS